MTFLIFYFLLSIDDELLMNVTEIRRLVDMVKIITLEIIHAGSLTVVSIFSLTKSLKTLIISMLLSFFIVKFVKFIVGICRIV